MSEPYIESIFMDSGAYTLYAQHGHTRMGSHGKELEARSHVGRVESRDWSYFDLRKGTEFRAYCERYARFLRAVKGRGVLAVNVDVIQNPEITWEVQNYFEQEHGLFPVPVIHSLEPLVWLDRYLEKGCYDLIGLGGFGHNVSMSSYMQWADSAFTRLCPASNGYVPLVRVHGFAMTAWKIMVRYPWWSVDSATWVKLSAFGWLYIPRWKEGVGWRYDRPPMQINVSPRSSMRKKEDRHLDNVSDSVKEVVLRWLDYCGVEEGEMSEEGEETKRGARTHHSVRNRCNLIYFKGLEESRPAWPHPLDPEIIGAHTVNHRKGFGL